MQSRSIPLAPNPCPCSAVPRHPPTDACAHAHAYTRACTHAHTHARALARTHAHDGRRVLQSTWARRLPALSASIVFVGRPRVQNETVWAADGDAAVSTSALVDAFKRASVEFPDVDW